MDLQTCFCSSARRAARVLTARYEAALEPHELSMPQFELLVLLQQHACNGRAIAKAIGLDAATVSRNLQALLKRNLVQGSHYENDARQVRYRLTPQGIATIRRALVDWRAVQQRTADTVPAGTLEALHAIAQTATE